MQPRASQSMRSPEDAGAWVRTVWSSRRLQLDHMNGIKIHDNAQCSRPTVGEIDDRVNEPGPILLQGDHGTVSFRNIRIKEHPKE